MSEVILVGANHINGLGLVRSLGEHGIASSGIIIGAKNAGFMARSKYWKQIDFAANTSDAITLLLEKYAKKSQKAVVIPFLDDIAAAVDEAYDRLSPYFILPSINKKQGEIVKYMDKYAQTPLAKTYGIDMLENKIIELSNPDSDIPYPRILKPVVSIEGLKFDIEICKTEIEYQKAIETLQDKGYERILVQHYLEKRTEYLLTGAVTPTRTFFTVARNERQWPNAMGIGSFSKILKNGQVLDFAGGVLNALHEFGYTGLIDIEIFEDECGHYYLNEINWRSSGRNYVSLYTKYCPAYFYVKEMLGESISAEPYSTVEGQAMNESYDLRHVLSRDISLGQWLKDVRDTGSFAFWYGKDIKPALYEYFRLCKEFIKRR